MSIVRSVFQHLPSPLKRAAHVGRNTLLAARVRAKAAPGFAGEAAEYILKTRRAKIASPIIDTARFPGQKAASADPGATYAVLSLIKSGADLERLQEVLADRASRETIKQLLAYRALGITRVALPGVASFNSKLEEAARMRIGDAARKFPPFETARYLATGDDGQSITVDCWLSNVIYTFLERQYFFHRDGVTITPQTGDIVLDGGACFGDTALLFASTIGSSGHVHSFEPLARQREVFASNLALNPDLSARISVHSWALDECSDRVLTFTDGGAGARASSDGSARVTTVTIDDFVQRQGLSRVDFIKMDIEGGETAALHGATQTIRRFRPRLAISIYHSLNDLVKLPLLVRTLAPEYDLYIQHHTIHADETILYGRPRE